MILTEKPNNKPVYAGLWIRTWAMLIDSVLIMILTLPIINAIYGEQSKDGYRYFLGSWDFLISYVLPAVVVIVFWIYKSATPGKLYTKLTIVDAKTGEKPSIKQFIIRYLGYYISLIPLGLGFIWIHYDKRKQGWHDKMAGTVVLEEKPVSEKGLDKS